MGSTVVLPPKEFVLKAYEKLVNEEDIDAANFLVASLAGYALYMFRAGEIRREDLSKYFDSLRFEIVDGPDYLNPYLMEVLGIMSDDALDDDALFAEASEKLRFILKEDRLDRLEV